MATRLYLFYRFVLHQQLVILCQYSKMILFMYGQVKMFHSNASLMSLMVRMLQSTTTNASRCQGLQQSCYFSFAVTVPKRLLTKLFNATQFWLELLTTQHFRLVEVEKGRSFFLNDESTLLSTFDYFRHVGRKKKFKYEIA